MDVKKINYQVESSKEGMPTLSIISGSGKKIYLHSKYNPLKEARNFENKFLPEKYDALVILGACLGYHLIPLSKILDKFKKIIIIDAINGIEDEITKNISVNFLTSSDKIIFLTGLSFENIEACLLKEIDFDQIIGLNVIEHLASIRVFSEYYSEIKKIVQKIINKKAANKATKKAFGMLYLRNIFKNYNYLPDFYPVSAFFNTLAEYPAIVIVSGPSIENYIDAIKKNQNKFFIITVDSALSMLLGNDINPDFFFSIDPQPVINEHLINLKETTIKSIPVLTVSSNPLLVKNSSRDPALLSLNTHPFSQILEDMFPHNIGNVDSSTGTVAGDAIMGAKAFGFKAIALMGLDFSFNKFKVYPRGTAYQRRFNNFNNRFNSVETANFNYIMKSCKGEKYYNKYTRKSFIQYKESIEGLLMKQKIKDLYNINNIGIPINRVNNIDFELFLQNFCKYTVNKKDITQKTLSGSKNLKQQISRHSLKKLLKDGNIFDELINASLDSKRDFFKISRLRSSIY